MTTKRNVEKRLDDLEPDDEDDPLGWTAGMRYLRYLKEVDESDDEHVAQTRSEYFGRDAGPGSWMEMAHVEDRLYADWPLFRVVTDADYLDPDEKFALPMLLLSYAPPEYNDAAVNQWWKRLPEHKQERVNRTLAQLSDDSTGDDES